MRDELTRLVAIEQQRGAIDAAISARQLAQILTVLGPAFLHQRAFDTTVTAATCTQAVHALLQPR
jgi:hypothetical protein